MSQGWRRVSWRKVVVGERATYCAGVREHVVFKRQAAAGAAEVTAAR